MLLDTFSYLRHTRAALAIAFVCVGTMAHADDCSTTLAPLFSTLDGLHHPPRYLAYVPFKMVTNMDSSSYASYEDGTAFFHPAESCPYPWCALFPAYVETNPSQHARALFSDRFNTSSSPANPFNVFAADELRVRVEDGGRVRLTSITWGGTASCEGVCAGRMVYCYINPTMYVISFGTPDRVEVPM